MKELVRKQIYTHAEVVATIGGEPVSYLPQSGGRIVGGRFKNDAMNPRAPYEVIVGNLPRVVKKAEMLADQSEAIPVFLKQGTNRWLFHGRMRCVAFDTTKRVRDTVVGGALRAEGVAGVLLMEDVR